MWVRFEEINITQNYYLFQKVQTYGKDTVMFEAFFTPEHSFGINLNKTFALLLKDAYDGPTLVGGWTFVGISVAHLFDTSLNSDENTYQTKTCVYIFGGQQRLIPFER
jgi:hypothetical protein